MQHQHEEQMPSPSHETVSDWTTQAPLLGSLVTAVILAVSIFFARRRSASKGNSILLLGPSDAGKTAILSTLLYNETLHSHTSMQANFAIISLPSGKGNIRLIDIPGHPRIRDQFREYIGDARAIIYAVDAVTISRNGMAVAEHLHQVMHALTTLPPSQVPPALLITAHKCDGLKPTSNSSPEQLAITRVRTVLERELEKRRAATATGVEVESMGADAEEAPSEMGGLECSGSGEFRFADWEGGEVTFIGTSVSIGKVARPIDEKVAENDGLASLRQWLAEL